MTDEDTPDGPSLLDLGSDATDPVEEFQNDSEDKDSFSAEHRKAVALDQVRRAVRRFGEDGISVSEVAQVTDLTKKTVRRHLDTLCNLREVYRQKKGKQMYLYYPNGKPLHGIGTERIESDDGETILEIQLAQGKNEDLFFHVTEKRFSLLEGETTEGAIIFPLDEVDEFFQKLEKLSSEVEDLDE